VADVLDIAGTDSGPRREGP